MCCVLHLLFVAIVSINISHLFVEGNNDTYSKVYVQHKNNIDAMVHGNLTHDKVYTGIMEIFSDTMINDGITFDKAEREKFIGFLTEIRNFTENKSYNDDEDFTDLMDEIQMVMGLTTPTIYEAMRFKEIAGLGTLQNIFSMGVENAFVDAWSLIKATTKNGSCAAYDQLLEAVTDTPAHDYIIDVFDPSLCTVSNETMEKWHQIFDQIEPVHRVFLLALEFNNQLPVFVFSKIAKAFRPAVYKRQFEKYVYTYPIIIALDRAIESTAFTKDEKKMLQVLATEMREQLPFLAGPEEREQFTSTKFAEIVSDNPSFLKTFAKVKLINDNANFYDLIMWITQSSNLEAMYNDVLNNRGISLFTRRRNTFFEWPSVVSVVKPCKICKSVMEFLIPMLDNHKDTINLLIDIACIEASAALCEPFAVACELLCDPLLTTVADMIIDALARDSPHGEICYGVHICS